jgi:hypothetical protein
MGKGWWSDQWGKDGGRTNREGVSDQLGRSGGLTNGIVTNGEGLVVLPRGRGDELTNGEGVVVLPRGRGDDLTNGEGMVV